MYDRGGLWMHRNAKISRIRVRGPIFLAKSPDGDLARTRSPGGDSSPQGCVKLVARARRASRRSMASSMRRVTSAPGGRPEASHILGYIDKAVNPGIVLTSLT